MSHPSPSHRLRRRAPLVVTAALALTGVVAVPVALSDSGGNGNAKGHANNSNALKFDLMPEPRDRGASTNNGAHKDQGSEHGDCKNDNSSNPHQQNQGNHYGYDCEGDDNQCEEGKSPDESSVRAAHSDDMKKECPPPEEPPVITPGPGTTVNNTTVNNTTINNAASTAAPAAAQVSAQSVRAACLSRRSFRIRIRTRKADPVVRATVTVNGRKVQTVRGRRVTAPVRLTGLPKGRTVVKIVATTKSGKKLRGTRTYHPCTAKRPSTIPNL